VEHAQRFIFLALAIGWTIFRLVRSVRAADSKRPGPAVPTSVGALPPQRAGPSAAAATPQSPIEPASGSGGFLAAAGIFVLGNVVIWPALFLLPAFDGVPAIWRLTAGVLANLFLIRLAAIAAARIGSRSQQSRDDDLNPIK